VLTSRRLAYVAGVMLPLALLLVWWGFHIGGDATRLFEVAMAAAVTGIFAATFSAWLWIRRRIYRTAPVRSLLRRMRGS